MLFLSWYRWNVVHSLSNTHSEYNQFQLNRTRLLTWQWFDKTVDQTVDLTVVWPDVFGLIRLQPNIYPVRGKHANYYTNDSVEVWSTVWSNHCQVNSLVKPLSGQQSGQTTVRSTVWSNHCQVKLNTKKLVFAFAHFFLLLKLFLKTLSEWVSDCCLKPREQFIELYHGWNKLYYIGEGSGGCLRPPADPEKEI
jgi:hypothetical protein